MQGRWGAFWASLGRNTERARKCYREKYGVTRRKYIVDLKLVSVRVKISAEVLYLLGLFVWNQGMGEWLWKYQDVLGQAGWFGAVQGALGLVLTFSLLLSPTNTRVREGYPGRLSDTQWVVHLDKE